MKRIITSLAILLALLVTIALSGSVQASSVPGNPWGYDFNADHGSVITEPPTTFCSYFTCIPSFWHKTKKLPGYVIECGDGKFSRSGGKSGSCSGHGGDGQVLYAHTSVTQSSPNPPVSSNPASSGTTTSPSLPLTGSDPYVH